MNFKRLFDVVVAFLGIVILLPILIPIALWIKLDSPGSIFFRQVRVGKEGKEFEILKFRTMVSDADKKGKLLTIGEDPRITRSGRFLRKYKLDELPQLLNVLRGEMSFVGPRPEVPRYVSLYNEQQRQVLGVRPGITDLASIQFRNENDLLASVTDPETYYIETIMPQKLALNLTYINQANVWNDLKIILTTLLKIIK
jgi:lipopolysaccharide/colanic/teichoic acid biosynthesis glycosyltransferase